MANVTGTDGDDVLNEAAGVTNANDIIAGLAGNDFIFGLDGDDEIFGGDGNDALYGGAGEDHIDGGTGVDVAVYVGSPGGVTINLAAGTAIGGDAQGDALIGIENLVGSDHGDNLVGNANANILEGLGGNDLLDGGLGNDWIAGGAGNDTVHGNLGNDLLEGNDGNDAIAGHEDDDTIFGGDGGDLLGGGDGDDKLDGGDGADIMEGGGGQDVLRGGDGADAMNGGDAFDILIGGGGADFLDGGNAADLADYIESSAGVVVSLTTGTGSGGDAEGDTLVRVENLRGSIFADVLTGDAGANELHGADGDDLLDGGAGADLLSGGNGSDTYVVDNAGDIVDESSGSGIDIVLSEVSFSLAEGLSFPGEIENLTLLGGADLNGTGNALANLIVGNTGANQLSGLGGNDTISGGAGRDLLSGGDGSDKFVFDAEPSKKTNVDRITDFAAEDIIVLDSGIFAKLKLGSLKGKAFHEGRKAHDGNDRIVYNDKNGKLIYDANGDDKGGATVFATLAGAPDLTRADFLVI